MSWTIRILKDKKRFAFVADELHAALTVACTFLRRGIEVEGIYGPGGVSVGLETVQEFCDGDGEAARKWRLPH